MQRVAFVMRVKEGQQQEYIRRHQNVWPEVEADLKRAGFHRMSIFISGLQLFVYMEVDDYEQAARSLAQSSESVRWEEHMVPILENAEGDTYDPNSAYPEGLPEVYFWQASGSTTGR